MAARTLTIDGKQVSAEEGANNPDGRSRHLSFRPGGVDIVTVVGLMLQKTDNLWGSYIGLLLSRFTLCYDSARFATSCPQGKQ